MSRLLLLLAAVAVLSACPTEPADDDDATDEPTTDPGPDCTDRLGLDAECPAASCAALVEAVPGIADGDYWIDAGSLTEPPFVVACDNSSDGGGWIRLSMDDSDGILAVSREIDNPWTKCDDDAAFNYAHVASEDDVFEDHILDENDLRAIPIGYIHPDTGAAYDDSQMAALRALVGELHPGVRMLATVGDDDGGDWQDGGGGGLEVYATQADGTWFLLTPGTGGDCGGGVDEWPTPDSTSSHYLWASNPDFSVTMGDVGEDPVELGGLPADAVIPAVVQAAIYTGGGISWGYNTDVFRVR
ncbi:MAG: hypothetical protein GY898_32105 [Proteobacteria bacterium]|nr:hypothetical protein [Pseudomonadota bacterium]